jgi:hypothetical protein
MVPEHVYEGQRGSTHRAVAEDLRGPRSSPLPPWQSPGNARGNAVSLRMTLGLAGPASRACSGAAGSNDQVENFDQGGVLRRG